MQNVIEKLRAVREAISNQIAELNSIGVLVDQDESITEAIGHLDEALKDVEAAMRVDDNQTGGDL